MNLPCSCGDRSPASTTVSGLAEVLANFPPLTRELLIPIFQPAQGRLGYLSRETMTQIAQHVGIPASKVFGVATFYNPFRLTAPGKHTILVCRGTACHVRGSDLILRAFESEPGIKAGETTKDREFTLDIVACIGSCSIAPVNTMDGSFHGRLSPKDAGGILAEVAKGVEH